MSIAFFSCIPFTTILASASESDRPFFFVIQYFLICHQNYEITLYKIPANTVNLGKKFHYLPTCHSTNDIAAQLLKDNEASDGLVVLTDHQTSGKGQGNNSWISEKGKNLTFSIVLKPEAFPASDQFMLTVISSLGITRALANLGITSSIKWPNDIWYGFNKVGGILINSSIMGKYLTNCVIGIGLNVNQERFEISGPISLRDITGREYDLNSVLGEILTEIEKAYLSYKSGKEALRKLYTGKLLGKNHALRYRQVDDGVEFSAITLGVDESGRIVLKKNEGELVVFNNRQIELVP